MKQRGLDSTPLNHQTNGKLMLSNEMQEIKEAMRKHPEKIENSVWRIHHHIDRQDNVYSILGEAKKQIRRATGDTKYGDTYLNEMSHKGLDYQGVCYHTLALFDEIEDANG